MIEAVLNDRLGTPMRRWFVLSALLIVAFFSISVVSGRSAEAGTAGYQWANCVNNGKQYSALIYWNSNGFEYKMDFKSPYGSVKRVVLRELTSLNPMWTSTETFDNFARSNYYSSRTIRSGQPWGWHRHWSGSNVLYQSALTVYLNDGNWTPDCTIHFYEQSDRF